MNNYREKLQTLSTDQLLDELEVSLRRLQQWHEERAQKLASLPGAADIEIAVAELSNEDTPRPGNVASELEVSVEEEEAHEEKWNRVSDELLNINIITVDITERIPDEVITLQCPLASLRRFVKKHPELPGMVELLVILVNTGAGTLGDILKNHPSSEKNDNLLVEVDVLLLAEQLNRPPTEIAPDSEIDSEPAAPEAGTGSDVVEAEVEVVQEDSDDIPGSEVTMVETAFKMVDDTTAMVADLTSELITALPETVTTVTFTAAVLKSVLENNGTTSALGDMTVLLPEGEPSLASDAIEALEDGDISETSEISVELPILKRTFSELT